MNISQDRLTRIARGVFRAMRYKASEQEIKEAIERASNYVNKSIRRAA